MPARNAFEGLSTESTLAAVRDKLLATITVAVSNFPSLQSTDVIDRVTRRLGDVSLIDTVVAGRRSRLDDAGALLTSSAPRRTTTATPPTLVTVRSYATVIVPANPNRLSLLLQNIGSDSSDDVFVGYGFNPTTSNGIRIRYTGDRLVENNYTGAIHAIASQTTYLRYLEVSL